jgi:transcription initiation factor TFIID subunit TAF12
METPLDAEMARVFNPQLIDVKPDVAREYTITDLLHKIDPSATIDPLAENLILDIADDFIDTIVSLSAEAVRMRNSSTVTADDVNFCISNKIGGTSSRSSAYSGRAQRTGIPTETYQKIQEIVDKQQG